MTINADPPDPLLDLKLFRDRMFRSAMLGGLLFRTGLGAYPFLMPLMLQLAFGMTPLESGLATFVTPIGALLSKGFVQRLYAAVGLPRALTAAARGSRPNLGSARR